MKPIWIIENFVKNNGYQEMISTCRDLGYNTIVLDSSNLFELNIKPKHQCVVFHGSIQLAQKLKRELDTCYPVVWLTEDNYKCSVYYPHYEDLLFNDKFSFTAFKDLIDGYWDIYSNYGREACIFVRPDSGMKPFTGQIVDLQEFDTFVDNCTRYGVTANETVVVSTPKDIIGEWRFICSEKEILSQSCYKYQGLDTQISSAPNNARDIVVEVLKRDKAPDKIFAVDICQGADKKFYLLEINAFSTCGTYACEKKPIIQEASLIAEKY